MGVSVSCIYFSLSDHGHGFALSQAACPRQRVDMETHIKKQKNRSKFQNGIEYGYDTATQTVFAQNETAGTKVLTFVYKP
ncbi:MAG TPA: hypothetical protein VGM63_04705 [Mucilaginibacter sp.]|jgi:hypothetical protein